MLTIFLILLSTDFYLFGGYQEYLLFFLFSILGIVTFDYFNAKNKITFYFYNFNLNLIIWTNKKVFFIQLSCGLQSVYLVIKI